MGNCSRCGVEYATEGIINRAKEKGEALLCADCRRTPAVVIKYVLNGIDEFCRPWHGDFDADDNPIDLFGRPFTGDVALCGHRDCVTQSHRPGMSPIRKVPKKKRVKYRSSRRKTALSYELVMASAEVRGQL